MIRLSTGPRRRLFWGLYPKILAIALSVLFSLSVFSYFSVRDFYTAQIKKDLDRISQILIHSLPSGKGFVPNPDAGVDLQNQFSEIVKDTGIRVTLIHQDGTVLVDTQENPEGMENHSTRPEFAQALKGEEGTSQRYSETQKRNLLYVAIPVGSGGQVRAVMRAGVPVTEIHSALNVVFLNLALATLFLVVIAAVTSGLLARRVSKPIEVLRKRVKLLAQGQNPTVFELPPSAPKELHSLGKATNKMANQLQRRIRTILEQRDEQEAVLSSMVEGVIGVDEEGKVFHANEAAARILETEVSKLTGKTIREAVRIPEMQALMLEEFQVGEPLEKEIVLVGLEDKYFQVHGTPLSRGKENNNGKLFVFNDVSKIRRLENHRREFVANVSHELRTPLTSIKGFVETLLAGAYKEPKEAEKFLGIIQHQTDRLSEIIQDLMRLSKIEREIDQDDIEISEGCIRPVIESSIDICRQNAKKKNISIEVNCEPNLKALIDPTLLEQAVINLVDNAIKYSEEKSSVNVEAKALGSEVVISVQDQGGGISQEHLSRIFERFYTVDKARSRKVGGTGLGLSIVKHIAIAHQGTATVESRLGEGSRFSIHLKPVIQG